MKIFNTLTAKKEDFIPLEQGKIKMYVCGVTVYDYCHIGHGRSAIVFDVIQRYFRYKGFETIFVKNFTDIDDKIIDRANKDSLPWDVVSKKFIDEYYKDMDMLGVARPDIEPKATEHIQEMIEVIKILMEKGFAYQVQEGNDNSVYFEVEKFSDYGKLSKKQIRDLLSGARVDINIKKKNPLDFALWKASKQDEPYWQSIWGKGRPGWHIECSAMAIKHLGNSIDIHGGGADLIFPHHENEIAQSESYTGKPFAKYWIHNEFITIDKEKMSKSLGNFFTIREILDKYTPDALRLFILSSHYRSPIEFSDEQIKDAELSIDRYYNVIKRLEDFINNRSKQGLSEKKSNKEADKILALGREIKLKFEEAMDDDFNTALAIGYIFGLIKELNKFLDSNANVEGSLYVIKEINLIIKNLSGILNIFNKTLIQYNRDLLKIKKILLTETDIERLINERQIARLNKEWQKADSIRKKLEGKGIILEDTQDGTRWKIDITYSSVQSNAT